MTIDTGSLDFGHKVYCDGDESNVLIVTGFMKRRDDGLQVECSWWFNGEAKSFWFPAWRLSASLEVGR